MLLAVASDWPIVLTLGVLLCASVVAGLTAQLLRLPRVTAYLLVGLLLAPATYELLPSSIQPYMPTIPHDHLDHLDPVGKLAMALVLFSIGCHFPLSHFRRILPRVLKMSAGELSMTFVLVVGGLLLLPLGVSWQAALLFGTLALATAPATTILVFRENESEGPVTELGTAMVAINNLVAVLLFEVIFTAIHYFQAKSGIDLTSELIALAGDILGSITLGIIAGLLTTYACGLLSQGRWLVPLIGMTTLLLGLCAQWQIPYLLAFLAMGTTVANASDRAPQVDEVLGRITGLLCVIFFVIHGAEMDLYALYAAGAVGVAYVVFRTVGKYFGVYFTADAHHDGAQVKHWLGATLFSQAGAAIALSAIAADGLGTLGERIQTVILGTVIVFELAGPIMIRYALLQSGEVPLAQAIRHSTTGALSEFRTIVNRVLESFGIDPFARRDPHVLKVDQIMRRNITSVQASASFDEVIDCLEDSRDNTLPVVGEEDELMGVIRYENLRHVLFDPLLGPLVRAEDLAVPSFHMLYVDETVDKAWKQLRHSTDDAMIVVSRDEPHRLLGMVRRRDMLRLYRKTSNGS